MSFAPPLSILKPNCSVRTVVVPTSRKIGEKWGTLKCFLQARCPAPAGKIGTAFSIFRSLSPMLAEEISQNPSCSRDREGLGGFAPVRMIVGMHNKQRDPHN
jgi:hypothetical protein